MNCSYFTSKDGDYGVGRVDEECALVFFSKSSLKPHRHDIDGAAVSEFT